MSPRESSGAEVNLLLDVEQPGLSIAYDQLIQELPINNGEKILALHRGTNEATKKILAKNTNGHLYVVLGETEEEEDTQTSGWATDNLTFLYSRVTDLPMPDTFLDRVVAVYSTALFELREDIIKEICRVLKPGGVFDVLFFDFKENVNGYYFEIKKEDYIENYTVNE